MVKLKINNEEKGTEGLYTKLGAVRQIAEIIDSSDEVEINVQYKKRGQAVESSSSITNPMITKMEILSQKIQRIVVEREDTKEILAEITNDDVKSANNIQVRIKPTYD